MMYDQDVEIVLVDDKQVITNTPSGIVTLSDGCNDNGSRVIFFNL